MRIVDLSAPIAPSPEGVPAFQRTDVEYLDHAAGAAEIEELFEVPADLLLRGEGWARETLVLGTHNSAHVDAPWHYNSVVAGEPAQTIDELPLEWFFAPGVVVDATANADGEVVGAAQMAAGIGAAGHDLSAGDIVLVSTGRSALYGQTEYMRRVPGVTAEATRWLYEQGVRVMGIDAWGWDAPLDVQGREALARDEPGILWAAHQANLPYSQI